MTSLRMPTEAGIPGVSIVIPAWNEEDRLPGTLEGYLPVVRELGVPFEVIVVADGNDNTPKVADAFRNDRVRCYCYRQKLGRGGAIFEGFRKARYSVVAFADADGSVPADDLRKILLLAMSGKPAVIASRRLLPEMVVIPERPLRRAIGTVWHALVRLLLGVTAKDAQCGLKAFSKEVVESVILPKVTITNRTFEVGMLYHLRENGIEVLEVPVHYVHDFRTRMPIGKAIPVMFLSLVGMFVVNILLAGRTRVPNFVLSLRARFSAV